MRVVDIELGDGLGRGHEARIIGPAIGERWNQAGGVVTPAIHLVQGSQAARGAERRLQTDELQAADYLARLWRALVIQVEEIQAEFTVVVVTPAPCVLLRIDGAGVPRASGHMRELTRPVAADHRLRRPTATPGGAGGPGAIAILGRDIAELTVLALSPAEELTAQLE